MGKFGKDVKNAPLFEEALGWLSEREESCESVQNTVADREVSRKGEGKSLC